MDEQKLLNSLFAYKSESMWQKGDNILAVNKDMTCTCVRGNEIWDKERALTSEEYKMIENEINKYKNDLIDLPENLDDGEYVIMDGSSYEIYMYGRKYVTDLAAINYEEDVFELESEADKAIYRQRKAQRILNDIMTNVEHIVGFKWQDEDDIPDIEG